MAAQQRQVPVSTIDLDTALCLRAQQINDYEVAQIAEAIRAGAELPPVILWKEEGRLVDGAHRVSAYRRVGGDEAPVWVEERSYPDEGAAVLEAMALNSGHGRRLAPVDIIGAIAFGERVGIPWEPMRKALALTEGRFNDLRLRTAPGPDGALIPLKSATRHLSGTPLTSPAVEVNRQAGGRLRFHVGQVLLHLRGGTVEWADEGTVALLGQLAEALAQALRTGAAA